MEKKNIFCGGEEKRRKIIGEGKYFCGEEKRRMKRRKVFGEGKIGADGWTEGSIGTKSGISGEPKCIIIAMITIIMA